jgi:hypothetical protein
VARILVKPRNGNRCVPYLDGLVMPKQDKRYAKKELKRIPLLNRAGQAEPWKYGPYRVVVQRRVTEEEQISIECYEQNLLDARATYDTIMDGMRAQMIAYNERVWATNQAKIRQLDRMIELRGENVRALDDRIRERREWLLAHGMEADDLPLFEDDDATNGGA